MWRGWSHLTCAAEPWWHCDAITAAVQVNHPPNDMICSATSTRRLADKALPNNFELIAPANLKLQDP
jgi:hypothetical protein